MWICPVYVLGFVHLTHFGALQFACWIVLEVVGYDFVVFLLISQFCTFLLGCFFFLMMIFFFLAFFFNFLQETNSIIYSLSCTSSLISFLGFFC